MVYGLMRLVVRWRQRSRVGDDKSDILHYAIGRVDEGRADDNVRDVVKRLHFISKRVFL